MATVYQFQDCFNGSNVFRFGGSLPGLTTGSTYNISGGYDFIGCATVVIENGSGPLYESNGVTFTLVTSCGDSSCNESKRSAILSKCSDGTILNALVVENGAFVGAAYLYNGECYEFVEFSECPDDITCPDLGQRSYYNCDFCVPTPTPTPTPYPTPSITPTLSPTPAVCSYSNFCLNTTFSSLSAYSGNYTTSTVYNNRLTYTGDGINTGYIYYFTSSTENYWCLSTSLGGSCLLRGASPCYSLCPDLSSNIFTSGVCPPAPTPQPDCDLFDFEAYFDCNFVVTPTPSRTPNCDDVNFDLILLTPTPTPSINCFNKDINYEFFSSSSTPTPTPTPTPTGAITRNIPVGGSVTFEIVNENFSCASVKVLADCNDGQQFYTNDSLIFNGIPVVSGSTFSALINGNYRCLRYIKDDPNLSSNSNVDNIISMYGNCSQCVIPISTPSPTPTQTNTPTLTMTPSPSPEINVVFVYESCSPIGTNSKPTQIIQTLKSSVASTAEEIFKDENGVCWTYNGKYQNTYIAPENVLVLEYTGDYFQNTPSQSPFGTCEECQTFKPAYEIKITNECQSSLSSYTISGGTVGDVIKIRARFVGVLTKLSGNFTRSELYLTSVGLGCNSVEFSNCYTDSDLHSFDIYTDCTVIMPSDTITLTTVADIVNSKSNGVLTVSVISVNNKVVNGISTNGCINSVSRSGNC